MPDQERCTSCDGLTGRAGQDDDSLYFEGDGPFCDECYRCLCLDVWEPDDA